MDKTMVKRLMVQVQYVHGRLRFEIEVPVALVEKYKPDDLVMTS